jgi:hypothetical protein
MFVAELMSGYVASVCRQQLLRSQILFIWEVVGLHCVYARGIGRWLLYPRMRTI